MLVAELIPKRCLIGIMEQPVHEKTININMTWVADFTFQRAFNFSMRDTILRAQK